MSDEDITLIGAFAKSATETVAAYVSPYNGKVYAHLRVMVPSVEGDDFKPTQKGVGVPLESFANLAKMIKKLREVAAPDVLVGSMPAGKDEIRVGTNEFKGNVYVYVRRYYRKGTDWAPSGKGFSIRPDQLPALLDLVGQAENAIQSIEPTDG